MGEFRIFLECSGMAFYSGIYTFDVVILE
jgi:hypothetical protein